MKLVKDALDAPERRRKKKSKKKHRKHKRPHAPTSTAAKPPAIASPVTPIATLALPSLTPAARHMARRFSSGITPALAADINAAGGPRLWFLQQLAPSLVPDPAGDEVDSWFPFLGRTTEEIYQRSKAGTEGFWMVMADLSRWTVCRRLESSRQVQEAMVDFWSNLLHVPLNKDAATFARADYDKTIRTFALTSFEELLQNAVTHPAMGISLSNNISTKTNPIENLGRELLELHTVGLGYTESDVKASAKMLTGYRVDLTSTFKASYDTSWHYVGPLSIFGFNHANGDADGRSATTAYLSYLARHSATAKRIARRLCVRFVSDSPSDDLVETVAAAYTASGTAIKPTLLAMVDHPEFAASSGLKLRTPQEDWQAVVRALGITVQQPTQTSSFVSAMLWQYKNLGNAPYEWPAPNGYPDVAASWSSAGRMLNSFAAHRTLTGHYGNVGEAVLPDLSTFLPPLPATLQTVIDTVSVNLLGEAPSSRISDGVAIALGWSLTRVVTAKDLAWYWPKIAIVTTLLDSPLHMYR